MRKLIALPATLAAALAASLTLAAPAFAQQYGYVEYGAGPVYGYAPAPAYGYGTTYGYSPRQERLDEGRYTTSDVGPGAITFSGARPDPMVGNNVSRGTDNRGTVVPPTRDRDVIDAFKKVE